MNIGNYFFGYVMYLMIECSGDWFRHLLGRYSVKIHKPRREQRLRHRFQRGIGLAQIINAVIECAKNIGDGALFFDGGAGSL